MVCEAKHVDMLPQPMLLNLLAPFYHLTYPTARCGVDYYNEYIREALMCRPDLYTVTFN